ncbi:autotransporter outer membrane beta-barrel domain-containing protein [Campylobacter showae]|uniref:autotransporter outer membrane beta-barrel domain-containing protein n=1 Tax=Campylobacter showae TaxID=204 RepID=UPI000F0779F3|nr:autotransporter outer membrane beta-barrel domain-containing protein [Campylobacter showae]
MKDIKIPIISSLSLAACLALIPSQVLAENATATVTGGGSNGLHHSSGTYYSGGYEGLVSGGSSDHIVTITGDPSGTDMSSYTIYGGGVGDPAVTPTTSANRNKIVVQNGATVTTIIGGEGKGATDNTVSITDATVKRAVLGGNGTWAGQSAHAGDAVGNTVNIEGDSQIIGDDEGITYFDEAMVSGGRAGYGASANNNTVNITGAATIYRGRIEGATINRGREAKGNSVNITGAVVLNDGQEMDGAVSVSPEHESTLEENHVVINNAGAKLRNITGANTTKKDIGVGGKSTAIGNYVILQNGQVESTTGSYMAAVSKNNYSKISGGTVMGDVQGGYAGSYPTLTHVATSENDYAEISGGDIKGNAYGFRNVNGDITGSYVKMTGGKVGDSAYGGLTKSGKISKSYVLLDGGEVGHDAIGGSSVSGNVEENKVEVKQGATVGRDIIGGRSETGSATNNTVNLKGAQVAGDVYAAHAANGSGNSVNFHSGSVGGTIYGLSNAGGTNNSLNVYNASTQKTAGDIANLNVLNFDGISNANGSADAAALNLTATGNTDINNAKFQLNGIDYDPSNDSYGSLNIEEGKEYYLIKNGGNTFTNFTEKAKQTTSEFTLKNSTTYDIMLKGLIKSSDDQSILIQGSKLTSRNITGGEFGNDEINRYNPIPNPVINVVNEDPNSPTNFNGLNINGGNNSTVNLAGGNNIGDITGGAGSTLNVGKNPTNPAAPNSITARNIGGFDDINIFMPPTVKDGDSMITLTDPTANTDLSNMRGKITAYISGNTDIGDTSTIHLIDKQGSGRLLLPDPSHLQTRVQQGATIEYETYGMVDANGRALDLKFSGKRRVKEDTKSFAETRAASLASLKSGSELITNYLDKLIPDGHLELFPFAISEAYSLRHETGSHVNSKGYGVVAGLASLTPNSAGEILSGVFVEYGRAKYDSYLDNGLHADGISEYIGGGLMLKQVFSSDTYIDASFRAGKISSDYNSNDWTYAIAPGILAHNEKFDISSTYTATHIGVGQIFDLNQNNKLDIYTKWLYAHTASADATISSGESYHFDSVASNRVRAGLRDTINLKDEHNLYFGGAYEYEFKGDAKASTMGLDAPKPSLKGSTGIFETGYKYESKNLIFSLGGKGYVGKTRGGAINAGFELMF